jgi:DNA-binding Lrp family transcriptional regulator
MPSMLTAFVMINADPADIANLGGELAAIDGVAEVYSVTGDEDLLVIVRVTDTDAIADLVTTKIASLEGIVSTRTLIAFRQYDPSDVGFGT